MVEKSGVSSPVEGMVVYPIIYKVISCYIPLFRKGFIHLWWWLFGISEPSNVVQTRTTTTRSVASATRSTSATTTTTSTITNPVVAGEGIHRFQEC